MRDLIIFPGYKTAYSDIYRFVISQNNMQQQKKCYKKIWYFNIISDYQVVKTSNSKKTSRKSKPRKSYYTLDFI